MNCLKGQLQEHWGNIIKFYRRRDNCDDISNIGLVPYLLTGYTKRFRSQNGLLTVRAAHSSAEGRKFLFDFWIPKALKADPDLTDIPVVMCTVVDDEQHGFSLGVSDYLTKPINKNSLLRTLNKLCPEGDCQVLVVEDDSVQQKDVDPLFR